MPDTDVAKRDEGKKLQSHEETRASERYLKPPVDIIETADGLTVIVDIPGASKEAVDINVDKGILTVNAPVTRCMPGRPLYTEFELATYYRQFTMPESLDHEKAKAGFSNGVLTLRSPLAEAAKPRKIEIKAG
ncbi:MAG: Hsp20/alpha crystallin family protein [Desulfuromonadaceae bacterium]|nr:Hsp20/alpha crystallin family protein [Desulfuromonadaceae bacterium]MDD2849925.1 Hsp20/alpha crystallin family protein [Desulfuromonadaceae bacterium]MDD4131716.1 Hsp20/alpha crystallin family protein [Desulfuromonadaceae bacterium]